MGLLKVIKKIKEKEYNIRLLVLGLDNAGKSTIVKKLCSEDISKVSPTLGFEIKNVTYKHFLLNIWDVGGQKSIRSFWRNYYEETDGIIWVVDSTDIHRLQDCRDELHSLLKEEKLAGATLLIFANKQDVDGALTKERIEEVC
eukprot:TRINITY_DN3907_c0_g1_i5.p2 TRINITY_DN3907_c0_g1~~TRINITY_DN3907_c0_g1_i5.p2  ORF type:complete len:143 (-),score=21.24 TRINITY_DN3907_c0_g1_i5:237-665(-)